MRRSAWTALSECFCFRAATWLPVSTALQLCLSVPYAELTSREPSPQTYDPIYPGSHFTELLLVLLFFILYLLLYSSVLICTLKQYEPVDTCFALRCDDRQEVSEYTPHWQRWQGVKADSLLSFLLLLMVRQHVDYQALFIEGTETAHLLSLKCSFEVLLRTTKLILT